MSHRSALCLLSVFLALFAPIVSPPPCNAFAGGITGWSGMRGPLCNKCHTGGVSPVVRIDGPETLTAAETGLFELIVEAGSAAQTGAGFNLSATAGALQAIPGQGAQLFEGELTHLAPKAATDGIVSWEFRWTAPEMPGEPVFFVAANSVDQNGTASGDRATAITRTVLVVPPATPTATPSPTPSPSPPPCFGDCDGDRQVTVSELVLAIDIALGVSPVVLCPAVDPNGSGMISVAALVTAIGHALQGCP